MISCQRLVIQLHLNEVCMGGQDAHPTGVLDYFRCKNQPGGQDIERPPSICIWR